MLYMYIVTNSYSYQTYTDMQVAYGVINDTTRHSGMY